MKFRNPVFTAEHSIDCEIEHPEYGWIPFTCDPHDTGAEFDTAALYAEMEPLTAPYVPPPPPGPAEVAAAMRETFRIAVQDHVDATARSRQYENGFALAGYVSSTIASWRAEAETFVVWRDQVWLFVFEKMAQVEAGEIDPPESPEALIGWLPQIEWP
jgi:hypothetical protein